MYLTHPNRPGQAITVPDDQAGSYLADGWVAPILFQDPVPVKPKRVRKARPARPRTPKPAPPTAVQ